MYETTNVGLRGGGGNKKTPSPSRSESEGSPASEETEHPAMKKRHSSHGVHDQGTEEVDDPPANIMQELDPNEARRLRAIEEARQDMAHRDEQRRHAVNQAKDKMSEYEQPSDTQSTAARGNRSRGRILRPSPDTNFPRPRPQPAQDQSRGSDRPTRVRGHPYYGGLRLLRTSTTVSEADQGYRRPLPTVPSPTQNLQIDPQSGMSSVDSRASIGPLNVQGSPRPYPIAPGMYGIRYADTPTLDPGATQSHSASLPPTPSGPPTMRLSTVNEVTAADRLRSGPPYSELMVAAEWQSREAERRYREDPEMQQKLIRERDALWRILREHFNVSDPEILWMLASLPDLPSQYEREHTR